MNCLKCGRETDQTFCEMCREDMARYPVKPGTIVQLPKDRSSAYTRRSNSWRAMISPEDQIAQQKRTILRLSLAVVLLSIALVGMGFALFRILKSPNLPPVGQNYSTVTKPTETTEDDAVQDATMPTNESSS